MQPTDLNWTYEPFHTLSAEKLYAILRLRSEVFVVEQACIFQDMDNKDQQCYHLCGWSEEQLVAYARILPPGLSFRELSIGRIVNAPSARKLGLGRLLVQKAIELAWDTFGRQNIRIGAQCYLNEFYQSLGFKNDGNEYFEDEILHIEMLLTA